MSSRVQQPQPVTSVPRYVGGSEPTCRPILGPGGLRYGCSHCHATLSRETDFGRHKNTHAVNVDNLRIPCDIILKTGKQCNYAALQRSNLDAHKRDKHYTFKCLDQDCPRRYLSSVARNKHLHSDHGLPIALIQGLEQAEGFEQAKVLDPVQTGHTAHIHRQSEGLNKTLVGVTPALTDNSVASESTQTHARSPARRSKAKVPAPPSAHPIGGAALDDRNLRLLVDIAILTEGRDSGMVYNHGRPSGLVARTNHGKNARFQPV